MEYRLVNSLELAKKIFPSSPQEIITKKNKILESADKALNNIISLNKENRTFDNTVRAYDKIASNCSEFCAAISVLKMTSPDSNIRDTAISAIEELEKFAIDAFESRPLYNSFVEYNQENRDKENLTMEEEYFLNDKMRDFIRAGLALDEEKFKESKILKKELTKLSLSFHKNLDSDQSQIEVSLDELSGLKPGFISSLRKTDNEKYILGCDYPTYFEVMENCSVSKTRESLWVKFVNKAYPANDAVLKEIIKLRDKLAKVLGFESYAHLDMDSQMAKNPADVEIFIKDLIARSEAKALSDFELLKSDLPEDVVLVDNKFRPWDAAYAKNNYKKKNFNIDENIISEYFPMDKTIKALFDIYQNFLGLRFEFENVDGLWHEDVSVISVFDKSNNKCKGYVFLDLYPRQNKYGHACMYPIVGSIKYSDKDKIFERPAVAVLITNFSKATKEKPSLLKHNEVVTFFHEFGHAMHQLLGQTEMASLAGTATRTDFVETPSQMFEEWVWDKNILKQISCHYITGKPLDEKIIDSKIAFKKFGSGSFVRSQCILSLLSRNLFMHGEDKDPCEISRDLDLTYSKSLCFDEREHRYASFGHLVNYDSKYYSYLWSRVFALDMFEQIKNKGLLDQSCGKRLIELVLARGGAYHPHDMLVEFLGRKPTIDAFLKDLDIF